jgi:hypothetical protein
MSISIHDRSSDGRVIHLSCTGTVTKGYRDEGIRNGIADGPIQSPLIQNLCTFSARLLSDFDR